MRIATYTKGHQRHVGVVSKDGLTVQALDIDPALAEQGVLGLIDAYGELSRLKGLGRGAATQLDTVKLLAPITRPRRNIFRLEERRVGKALVSKCNSRWWP